MLQVYRVITEFQAEQLDREPAGVQHFQSGESLVVLREENSYIVFCRHSNSMDLADRDRFSIDSSRFERYTEQYTGAGST